MAHTYTHPPPDWIVDGGVLLTGTCPTVSEFHFARALREREVQVVGILEWDEFCRSLLDPDDARWSRAAGGTVCLALLRFEDWDHFSDHLRDPSIEPSYDLVRRKTSDLIQCLTIAANRSRARFGVLVQWSAQARRCQEVNDFFEQVTQEHEIT